MLTRRSLVTGLAAASLGGCGVAVRRSDATGTLSRGAAPYGIAPGLTALEHQWARTAWRYLENNTDSDSGLVSGTDRSPVWTAWNMGDALAAIVAAYELKLVEEHEFDLRLSRVLGFVATMDLSVGQLPNKAYHVTTGKMAGFDGRPDDIGWSAVDTGRLLLWLRIVGLRHPRFQEHADKAVLRWRFCDVLDECGNLSGSSRSNGQLHRYAEGRLGYQQLAGAGFAAWGFDARGATAMPATEVANIYGMQVRYDARDPRTTGAQAPVLTMPYVLAALEYGGVASDGSTVLRDLAPTVYKVQEERWRREGVFTARTDYQLREPPFVVLDSIYAAGYAWNTVSHDGGEYARLAQVSTRAAFGLWALAPGEYADRLMASMRQMYDPDRGWFEGRLEQGGAPNTTLTLTTNAAILETLLFKSVGVIAPRDAGPSGPFRKQVADPFGRLGRCWPGERETACQR